MSYGSDSIVVQRDNLILRYRTTLSSTIDTIVVKRRPSTLSSHYTDNIVTYTTTLSDSNLEPINAIHFQAFLYLSKMNKPVRIRSQIILIVYKDKLPFDELVNNIKSLVDQDIKYVIKYEYYVDSTVETIIFVDFKQRPDIKTKKLEFNSTDFSLLATNDDYWPLSMILKLSNDDIQTNIDEAVINMYVKKLHVDRAKKIKTNTKKQDNSAQNQLKPLPKKAENRIIELIQEHKKILTCASSTENRLTELNRCVTNATNYRYKYKIPEELDKQISNMRKLMRK